MREHTEECPVSHDGTCDGLCICTCGADEIRAAFEAARRATLRKVSAVTIKVAADLVRLGGPDKQRGPEVVYREPVVTIALRLRSDIEAIAAEVPSEGV